MQADEDCDKRLIKNQMRLIQQKLKECKEYSDKLKNKLADELD
jgi:predicted house-cleaning noncanonical NTP pyrophosphatase (MazG superfamily)